MGFGHGAAGNNGNGFQLLMVIFVELFGVTLGQMIASISPSVQVCFAHLIHVVNWQAEYGVIRLQCCIILSWDWSSQLLLVSRFLIRLWRSFGDLGFINLHRIPECCRQCFLQNYSTSFFLQI